MYWKMIVLLICAQLLGITGVHKTEASGRRYNEIIAQRSRSAAMVTFLDAYARNPDAFDNATMASYQATLGTFNDAQFVVRDDLVQKAYFQACASLFAGAARRPDAADALAQLLSRTSGTAANYQRLRPAGQSARAEAVGALIDTIARSPDASTILAELAQVFCPPAAALGRIWDIAACARMEAVAVLLGSIARQPGAIDTLMQYSRLYLGEYDNGKKESPALRSARLLAVAAGCEAIARQPAAAEDILSAARLFCGPALVSDLDTRAIMQAYVEAVGIMITTVARNSAAVDTITDFFNELTGGPPTNAPALQSFALEAIGALTEAVGRMPPMQAQLETLFTVYTGCPISSGAD